MCGITGYINGFRYQILHMQTPLHVHSFEIPCLHNIAMFISIFTSCDILFNYILTKVNENVAKEKREGCKSESKIQIKHFQLTELWIDVLNVQGKRSGPKFEPCGTDCRSYVWCHRRFSVEHSDSCVLLGTQPNEDEGVSICKLKSWLARLTS